MSADLGPGDWVECIRGGGHTFYPQHTLSSGSLYVVRAVTRQARKINGEKGDGALLVGVILPVTEYGHEASWNLRRFRPIYRPKSTFIDSLKQPAPERELETT